MQGTQSAYILAPKKINTNTPYSTLHLYFPLAAAHTDVFWMIWKPSLPIAAEPSCLFLLSFTSVCSSHTPWTSQSLSPLYIFLPLPSPPLDLIQILLRSHPGCLKRYLSSLCTCSFYEWCLQTRQREGSGRMFDSDTNKSGITKCRSVSGQARTQQCFCKSLISVISSSITKKHLSSLS